MPDIRTVYEAVARQFDRDRSRSLMERQYLEALLSRLGGQREILDLGCGGGEPIAKFFIDAGCRVTGIDCAAAVIAICRIRSVS